jgi:hypothetical protein
MAEVRWGLGFQSGSLPWETPLGAVLTVIEGMALLMLVSGLLERPWLRPLRGVSTVIGGMIPLWAAWWREWFGGPAHLWTPNAEARQREE